MRDYRHYLKNIVDAMEAIESFVKGFKLDEFERDDKTSSAVIRKFEIIGEATKRIPEDLRQRYPKIPWKEMAGMRDKLMHFYFGIDYKLIWQTINQRIPRIKPIIRQIIEDLENEKSV